jgi:hypothetical protein
MSFKHLIETTKGKKWSKPNKQNILLVQENDINKIDTPNIIKEALFDPNSNQSKEAINVELASLNKNKT